MKKSKKLEDFDPKGTVFAEFTQLSKDFNSVNLGQGFPNFPVEEFIRNAAIESIKGDFHQYARSEGHPRLVNSLSNLYSPILNRPLNGLTEIMTCVGASEAIYCTVQAFIDPGDEVIIIQPFFDCYPASVVLAGGIPKFVSLEVNQVESSSAQDWALDFIALERAISVNTKIIILNNPNNPLGKVWSKEELDQVAIIAEKFDILILADEVYEFLVFSDSPVPMIKFASIPGMWKRTITVGSLGKMFGITGWKIGWIIAPAEIVRSAWMIHQYLPFSVASPLQEAAAIAIDASISCDYFSRMKKLYEHHRNILFDTLKEIGMNPIMAFGGYFIVAEIKDPIALIQCYSTYLTKTVGVTSIPMRAFYRREEASFKTRFVRFAFCKDSNTLNAATAKLKSHFL